MGEAERALDDLMRVAARAAQDFVAFDPGPPALKSRFFAEEAAAAALAATGVLASDLWEMRTGRRQAVRVGIREAGTGLISFLHQSFDDPSRAPPLRPDDGSRGAPMGFFPTKDGRVVYLHPSFPPSAAKLQALMGSPADRAEAERTALSWNAQDLEDAIAAAGICGAMVRTPEEWDASEPGRMLANRPPVEVIQIGDSPPVPLPDAGDMPLSGVRMLDLTRVLAGPTCGRTLAQYGADVLYVASPHLPSTPIFVADTNPGKLSAFLDLTQAGDLERLKDLVRTADLFSQGYRGGALERRGLGPLELARINPGLIYISINAYGHEGPWRNRPGWEQLAQTVTGLAYLHGQHVAGGTKGPQLQPGAVTDYTTGYLAALGGLVALHRRARFGGAYLVRVSLSRTGMWLRSLGLDAPSRMDAAESATAEELAAWQYESETGYGTMRRLRPAVRMSETPPRWTRPVVPLGTHPAAWPT